MRAFVSALAFFFAVAAIAGAESAPSAALHAGDKLHVEVAGEDALTQDVAVADDGTIGLPLVGQVRVGGATPAAASETIAAALKRYVRDPHVVVQVQSQGHITVLVLGDVVNSGSFELRPDARLSDAITAAGGMEPAIAGAYPVARVALPDGTVYHLSLDKLLRGGDPARDVTLADRAAVYVPGPVTFDVTVLGAVDHPGSLTVNDGDPLSIAIAKAGNSQSSHADLTHVMVTRTEPNGATASHPVDLYQALEHGDNRYDPRLRKGDVVYVPVAKQTHGTLTNVIFILSRLLFL